MPPSRRPCVVERPDGARLAVQVEGRPDAPCLVLLQGQASAHTWWDTLRGRFADRFRTVTLDVRGTGATVAPAGELSTRLLAEDVVAVLDGLGVEVAHVYGTSMGGRVAQLVAVQAPARVASMVLACTGAGGAGTVASSPEVRRALLDPDEDARRATLVRLFYTGAWGQDASRSRLLGDPTMSRTDRIRHRRMSERHDAWDLLPRIACPVLVLHGGDDALTPPGNADRLLERLPDARLHVHEAGRHGFFDEFADELDPVLDAFWDTVLRPG